MSFQGVFLPHIWETQRVEKVRLELGFFDTLRKPVLTQHRLSFKIECLIVCLEKWRASQSAFDFRYISVFHHLLIILPYIWSFS